MAVALCGLTGVLQVVRYIMAVTVTGANCINRHLPWEYNSAKDVGREPLTAEHTHPPSRQIEANIGRPISCKLQIYL